MKVVFNGTVEKRTSGGCNCKGRTTSSSFVRSKIYILPSGKTQSFIAGKPVEVSEQDGEFLLSYIYKDANDDTRAIFSKVE
jgi:hypothetical protein